MDVEFTSEGNAPYHERALGSLQHGLRGRHMVLLKRLTLCVLFASWLGATAPASFAAAAAPAPPTCFGRVATIVGTEGDDALVGTPGPDVIVGLGGNDTIGGGRGSDFICAGPNEYVLHPDGYLTARELVHGGRGHDRISGGAGLDVVFGDDGRDRIRLDGNPFVPVEDDDIPEEGNGGDGNDVVRGGDGNDELRGGEGRDMLDGGPGDDFLGGDRGDDFLHAGPDNDGLAGHLGNDTGYGENGADVWYDYENAAGRDRFRGGPGDDVAEGGLGADVFSGGPGSDWFLGGRGDDVLRGGENSDVLIGDRGDDVLDGGLGGDWASYAWQTCDLVGCLRSAGGSIRVDLATQRATGDFGVDRLAGIENAAGGGGRDVLLGNSGTNHLQAGAGDRDRVEGRGGSDTFSFGFPPGLFCCPVTINLATGRARASDLGPPSFVTLESIENAIGHAVSGAFDRDTLIGNDGPNRLVGLDGDDILRGVGGDDTLLGGDGDDDLDGGEGSNVNDGGEGTDRCVLPSSPPGAVDCETT